MTACLSPFLWIGTILAFFHSKGNLPVHKEVLKIMFRSLQTESPHIFDIRILISSWPWASLWPSLLIIWRMPSFAKWQVDNVLSVRNGNSEGKILPFEIGGHLLAKKDLKIPLFASKATIYLSPWNRGGMQGIFFPFNSVFKSDQQHLLLVFGSPSLC